MQPAVLIRFWPAGPWRFGAADGSRNQVDSLFRSDRFFSALTLAAKQLGFLDEWLAVTAQAAAPSITLSSLFPFQGDTLFVTPPATLWPPSLHLVTAPSPVFLARVRWSAARFIPITLAETILLGQKVLADQWLPDTESECLLRRDRPSTPPFRSVLRFGAAVDRLTRTSPAAHSFAGIEFEPGAGLWAAVCFADDLNAQQWRPRVNGMIRLLGDTGLGGRRSAGGGQIEKVEFSEGAWPRLLFPKVARAESSESSSYWTLSLFSPASADQVDWRAGDYTVLERGSAAGRRARFIAEGSVLSASSQLVGAAVDVASEQADHPVYRSGIVLALRLPIVVRTISTDEEIVETTVPEELAEPEPVLEPEEPVSDAPELELPSEALPDALPDAPPELPTAKSAEEAPDDAV